MARHGGQGRLGWERLGRWICGLAVAGAVAAGATTTTAWADHEARGYSLLPLAESARGSRAQVWAPGQPHASAGVGLPAVRPAQAWAPGQPRG